MTVGVMEDGHTVLLNSCIKTMSLMRPAPFIRLEVMKMAWNALLSMYAKTAILMNLALYLIAILSTPLINLLRYKANKI